MKRFSFLQVVVLAALLVTVASCGAPMYSEGDAYEDAPRANVYYSDPYFGGGNAIVVERDPYTGRFYQVSPGLYGGDVYSTPANPYYGRRYNNNRYYNNNRNVNSNRNYNSNRSNNNYYRTYPQNQRTQPQQTPVQRQQVQQQRNEAKDAILGHRRN